MLLGILITAIIGILMLVIVGLFMTGAASDIPFNDYSESECFQV